MITYKFCVAKSDVPGMPGVERGTPVLRDRNETMEGGYEYVVWHRLDDGTEARTRIEHLPEFMTCEIDGRDMDEVAKKVTEIADGMRSRD